MSHESAMNVHGIGEFESRFIHLTVPLRFTMRDGAVALHYADLPSDDISERPGQWVLIGGMALEVRLRDEARLTKDVDLGFRCDVTARPISTSDSSRSSP